jgi:hypothetical protein
MCFSCVKNAKSSSAKRARLSRNQIREIVMDSDSDETQYNVSGTVDEEVPLGAPGGEPSLGTVKVMKGRLWGRPSLLMGALLGNLERAPLPGTLRYG